LCVVITLIISIILDYSASAAWVSDGDGRVAGRVGIGSDSSPSITDVPEFGSDSEPNGCPTV
jgi:hypothetical protein